MATEEAKTLGEQSKVVSGMLFEPERVNEVVNDEGFSVLCKDDGNGGCSGDMGLLGTKNESGGNIRDGKVGVVDKVVGVENGVSVGETKCSGDEKGGVFDKEVEVGNVINVGHVLCEDVVVVDSEVSVGENLVDFDKKGTLGTETVNVGNYRDADDKLVDVDEEGVLDKGLAGEYEMSVAHFSGHSEGNVLFENNLDKEDKHGISLVVDLSNDKNVEKCNGVETKGVLNTDDQGNIYAVGDFVWGKFNSHPWWPAQIIDPKDASDKAKKCRPDGNSFLVAYFGDGSFLWRSPNLLKPFSENFDELSKKSDSVIFLIAVKDALTEIGRVAERKLACHCISEEKKAGLTREAMVNAGIQKGVLGTECDSNRLPISDFLPLELLSKVKSMAVGDYGITLLELTGIRSFISAFYRAKDGRKLDCCYYEWLLIEGMGDIKWRGLSGGNNGSVLNRCDGHKDSKKRKHVAKTVGKSDDKKKIKSVGNFLMSPRNEVSMVESGGQDGQAKAVDENAVSVLEQENGEGNASRKRRQSKYLSHPYTDPKLSVKLALESMKSSKFATAKPFVKSENGAGDKKKMVESAKLKVSPEEVVAQARAAALDPQRFFSSDSRQVVNDFIYSYRKTMAYASRSNCKSLSKKGQNETNDEMITMSEMKRGSKKNKRANESMKGMGNKEGLVFVKEKLQKMTKLVENCDEEKFADMKISLEMEMKELLEMLKTVNN